MNKCKECKWFDPQFNDCIKDDHRTYKDDEACDKFELRKECEHRYENCDINGCSIICHKFPSECGCDFYYECRLDDRRCDENCERHEKYAKLNKLKTQLGKLYSSKTFIEELIEEYKENISKLEEELNIEEE